VTATTFACCPNSDVQILLVARATDLALYKKTKCSWQIFSFPCVVQKFVNQSAKNSSQHYAAVWKVMTVPSMRVFFASSTHLCLCFIKVIVLTPSSVYSYITAALSIFMFHVSVCSLLVPCMLKSIALRVGVKTILAPPCET